MLVWLTLPFDDFCGIRFVAVNSVYKLQFFTFMFGIQTLIVSPLTVCINRIQALVLYGFRS